MPHPLAPTVVLLASVLKPTDDTRMYEKFGRTLARRPGWQVHVAGRAQATAARPAESTDIQQHSLFSGSRLSWHRLGAQRRYWQLLQLLKPDLVIVHAPELLPLTILWQRLNPESRFLYDIRENYSLNVTTQQVYGGLLRRVLAAGLRGVETLAARRAAGVILAEQSYARELPFLNKLPAGWVVVLENKYQPAPDEAPATPTRRILRPDQELRLLYSGTISELNGVFEAITFTRQLRQHWPLTHLTIIGYCQQPDQLQRLHQAVAEANGAVTLIGGAELIPHTRIITEIRRSHLGLLPYRPHPSTWRCIPTKLYEYLAHGLPMLIPPNPLWQGLVDRTSAGLVADFGSATATEQVKRQLGTTPFYPQGPPQEAFWESEATKLWALLDAMR